MATKQVNKKAGLKGGNKKKAPKKTEESNPYAKFRDLDQGTWDRIENFAKEAERELDDIVAEIMETAEEDYLQQYPEEQRYLLALRIVASRITVEGLVSADLYQLLVLDVEHPKVIKTKNGPKTIANIAGIAAKYDDDGEAGEASFAEVTFWDEDADKVNDAQIGVAYDCKLGGNYKEGRFQLRGTAKTNWKNTIELDAEPLEIIQDLYDEVELADLVEVAKQKKPVLVKGNVTFSRSGKSEKGNEWASITIWDNSQELEDRGVTVFCSPHQAIHGTGSSLWVLGTVSPGRKNKETGEVYSPTVSALTIIPELSIPQQTPASTAQPGEDIGDDDEGETVDFSEFDTGSESEEEQSSDDDSGDNEEE